MSVARCFWTSPARSALAARRVAARGRIAPIPTTIRAIPSGSAISAASPTEARRSTAPSNARRTTCDGRPRPLRGMRVVLRQPPTHRAVSGSWRRRGELRDADVRNPACPQVQAERRLRLSRGGWLHDLRASARRLPGVRLRRSIPHAHPRRAAANGQGRRVGQGDPRARQGD